MGGAGSTHLQIKIHIQNFRLEASIETILWTYV
jgi:hypothetical protein